MYPAGRSCVKSGFIRCFILALGVMDKTMQEARNGLNPITVSLQSLGKWYRVLTCHSRINTHFLSDSVNCFFIRQSFAPCEIYTKIILSAHLIIILHEP